MQCRRVPPNGDDQRRRHSRQRKCAQVNILTRRNLILSGGSNVTPCMNTFAGGNSAHLSVQTPTATTTTSPSVAGVAVTFPQNRYSQNEGIGALTDFAGPEFRRFALSGGVQSRHTALPLPRYGGLSGFTEANDAFVDVDVALGLGEQALLTALDFDDGYRARCADPGSAAGHPRGAAPGRKAHSAVRPGLSRRRRRSGPHA